MSSENRKKEANDGQTSSFAAESESRLSLSPNYEDTAKRVLRSTFGTFLLPFIFLGLCTGLGIWGVLSANGQAAQYRKELGQKTSSAVASQLQFETTKSLYSLKGLGALTSLSPQRTGLEKNFDDLCSTLYDADELFSNSFFVGAVSAPFGSVQAVFPKGLNSSTIWNELTGSDAMTFAASKSPGVIVTSDASGEQMLLLVQPVFVSNASASETWGFAAASAAALPSPCPFCYDADVGVKFWGFVALALRTDAFVNTSRLLSREDASKYHIDVSLTAAGHASIALSAASLGRRSLLETTARDADPSHRRLLQTGPSTSAADSSFASSSGVLQWAASVSPANGGSWRPGWRGVAVALTVVGAVLFTVAQLAVVVTYRWQLDYAIRSVVPGLVLEDLAGDSSGYGSPDGGSPADRILHMTSQLLRGEMPALRDVLFVRGAVQQNSDVYSPNLDVYLDLNEQDADVTLALMKELGHLPVPSITNTPFVINTRASSDSLRESPNLTLQGALDLLLNEDIMSSKSMTSEQSFANPEKRRKSVSDQSLRHGGVGSNSSISGHPGRVHTDSSMPMFMDWSAARGSARLAAVPSPQSILYHANVPNVVSPLPMGSGGLIVTPQGSLPHAHTFQSGASSPLLVSGSLGVLTGSMPNITLANPMNPSATGFGTALPSPTGFSPHGSNSRGAYNLPFPGSVGSGLAARGFAEGSGVGANGGLIHKVGRVLESYGSLGNGAHRLVEANNNSSGTLMSRARSLMGLAFNPASANASAAGSSTGYVATGDFAFGGNHPPSPLPGHPAMHRVPSGSAEFGSVNAAAFGEVVTATAIAAANANGGNGSGSGRGSLRSPIPCRFTIPELGSSDLDLPFGNSLSGVPDGSKSPIVHAYTAGINTPTATPFRDSMAGLAEREGSAVSVLDVSRISPVPGGQQHGGLSKSLFAPASTVPRPVAFQEVEKLLLRAADSWEFNAFELAEATGGHSLSCLTYFLLTQSGLINMWRLNQVALARCLRYIEAGYQDNPYHSATHATDVLQRLHMVVTKGGLVPGYVDNLGLLSVYLAAVLHDYGHLGRTNDFLIATSHPLALTYNDRSPLENHHLAAGLAILRHPDCNFMEGRIGKDKQAAMRKLIIELVMATDMKGHFALVGQFKAVHRVTDQQLAQLQESTAKGTVTSTVSQRRRNTFLPTTNPPHDAQAAHRIALSGRSQGSLLRAISGLVNGDSTKNPTHNRAPSTAGDADATPRLRRPVSKVLSFRRPNAGEGEGEGASKDKAAAGEPDTETSFGVRKAPVGRAASTVAADDDEGLSDGAKGSTDGDGPAEVPVPPPLTGYAKLEKDPDVIHATPLDDAERFLALQMALKCCDLGHLTSPLALHQRWVSNLEEEVFRQGDAERDLGLPISPLFDRSKQGISKSQIGFFEIVALPMFSSFTKVFPGALPLLDNLMANYAHWKALEPPPKPSIDEKESAPVSPKTPLALDGPGSALRTALRGKSLAHMTVTFRTEDGPVYDCANGDDKISVSTHRARRASVANDILSSIRHVDADGPDRNSDLLSRLGARFSGRFGRRIPTKGINQRLPYPNGGFDDDSDVDGLTMHSAASCVEEKGPSASTLVNGPFWPSRPLSATLPSAGRVKKNISFSVPSSPTNDLNNNKHNDNLTRCSPDTPNAQRTQIAEGNGIGNGIGNGNKEAAGDSSAPLRRSAEEEGERMTMMSGALQEEDSSYSPRVSFSPESSPSSSAGATATSASAADWDRDRGPSPAPSNLPSISEAHDSDGRPDADGAGA